MQKLTTTTTTNYAIADVDDPAELLAGILTPGEEFGVADLPRIKMPSAGSTTFELPDGTVSKAFEAIILHRQPQRAFWAAEFSGENNPPDCSSRDNLHGEGLYGIQDGTASAANPTGLCKGCPMAAWGSGKDGGQACRQLTQLFLLMPGALLPTRFTLPPSSYKVAQTYALNLVAMGVRGLHRCTTRVSTVLEKSAGGISYARLSLEMVEPLPADVAAKVDAYRQQIVPAVTGQPVE
mgnify:FL=1|jgi:hypothetical protein